MSSGSLHTIPLRHYIIYNLHSSGSIHTSSTPRFLRSSGCRWGSDGVLWGFELVKACSFDLLHRGSSANPQPAFSSPFMLSPSLLFHFSPIIPYLTIIITPLFLSPSSVLFIPRYIIWVDSEYSSLSFSLRSSLTSVHYLYRCPFIFLFQTFIFSTYTSLVRTGFVF